MLNIFVLEDDFLQQTRIETAIKKCMTDHHLKYKYLEVFGKPTQLLEAIKETGNHQFFFLDIEIKGEEKKGMEIAREIREKDPSASIVFVTTHSEFMPVTYRYRVSALDRVRPIRNRLAEKFCCTRTEFRIGKRAVRKIFNAFLLCKRIHD